MAFALYYQYVIGDEPCQVCVHVRIWVVAIWLLSIPFMLFKVPKTIALAALALLLIFTIGFSERSFYLLTVENGIATKSCQFFLDFPVWFALDRWFPCLFEVRALCSVSPDMFWGLSMAQSLVAIAIGLFIAVIIAIVFKLRA